MDRSMLYYTFDKDVPSMAIPRAKKVDLMARIAKMDSAQCKALFLLICEHYHVTNPELDMTDDTQDLFYGMTQEDDGVHGSLDNIPNDLLWILHRFGEVVKPKTTTVKNAV